jgi:hypothetical protein
MLFMLFMFIYNLGPILYKVFFGEIQMTSAAVLKHDKPSTQDVQWEKFLVDDQSPEKPKKKKVNAPEHTSQKMGKKRRRADAEEQRESMEHKAQSEEAEGESGPPKKKHKNRTNFADPREDTQLNTQSRKGTHYSVVARLDEFSLLSTALEYVFTQMNRPSRWKFNKARQNWLIRNIWSSETVSRIFLCFLMTGSMTRCYIRYQKSISLWY